MKTPTDQTALFGYLKNLNPIIRDLDDEQHVVDIPVSAPCTLFVHLVWNDNEPDTVVTANLVIKKEEGIYFRRLLQTRALRMVSFLSDLLPDLTKNSQFYLENMRAK